jgi:hypothetical protein
VHLVVGDVSMLAEINGIDDFVESIRLIPVKIPSLTTMALYYMLVIVTRRLPRGDFRLTRVVEEERVIRRGPLNQPVHGTEDVLLRGLTHGVLLVIREDYHVFPPIPEVLNQVGSHVANVIDTAAQLTALAKVVNADQQAFPAPSAVRVAVCVALRCSLAEVLRPSRGRWRTSTIAVRRR